MGLDVFALCCGYLEFDRRIFFPGTQRGKVHRIPVPSFLVVHPQGAVLFDTGIHPGAVRDPAAHLDSSIAGLFRPSAAPGENLLDQLALTGVQAEKVVHVVNSHFHFDHCGGNVLFPWARFWVQRRELARAFGAANPYNPGDFDHHLEYTPVDGEMDLFGDGTIVLLPTPGHTPGHQSLLVRVDNGRQLLLTADACYSRTHLTAEIMPKNAWNIAAALSTLRLLKQMSEENGNLELIFSHDPEQWRQHMSQGQRLA